MGLWQPEDLFRLPILPQNVGHASSLNRQTRATWVWTSKPRVLLVLQNYYHVQNEINTVARRFKRSRCYWKPVYIKPVKMFHESIDCAISLCFVHPWKSPLCKVRPNLLAIGVCMFDEFHSSFDFKSNMSRGMFKNKNECWLASTFHSRVSPQF